MIGLPWVGDSDLLWDTLLLDDEVWPGLASVETIVKRKVDSQKKAGDDGGNLVDQGYEPADIKITIRVWLREQWEELEALLETIHPRKKGGIRRPVAIVHPEPMLKGVTRIYITQIGAAVPGRGAEHGSLTLSIEAIEWFAAPKKAKAKTDATGGQLPSAKDVVAPNQNPDNFNVV